MSAAAPQDEPVAREFALAAADLASDRWESALARLEPLRAAASGDSRRQAILGDVLWRAGALREAGAAYLEALAQSPGSGAALLGAIRWHLARGAEDEALSLSQDAVGRSPGVAEAWILRAAVLLAAGRGEEALAARARAESLLANAPPRELVRSRALLDVVRAAGFFDADLEREQLVARLDYELVGGVPVVVARIGDAADGSLELPMVIDTGGSFALALDRGACAPLALARVSGSAVEGLHSAREPAESTLLPRLELDSWRLRDVPALLCDVPRGDAAAEPVAPYRGVLGTALFDRRVILFRPQRDLCLLIAGRQAHVPLTEEQARHDRVVPCYRVGDGKLVFHFSAEDGRERLALLDTGSARTLVSRQFATTLGFEIPVRAPERVRDARERPTIPLSFAGARFLVAPGGIEEALDRRISPRMGVEVSLLLGMDFVRTLTLVAIDGRRLELHFVATRSER